MAAGTNAAEPGDVVVMMGTGDVTKITERLSALLTEAASMGGRS